MDAVRGMNTRASGSPTLTRGELPDVNDVPQFENAKKWSDLGVKDGWKERK
jgi:hypothetical protein